MSTLLILFNLFAWHYTPTKQIAHPDIDSVSLTVRFAQLSETDTIISLLMYEPENLSIYHKAILPRKYEAKPVDNTVTFRFNAERRPFMFSVRKSSEPRSSVLRNYVGDAGDRVDIRLTEGNLVRFSGHGSLKYQCKYEIDRLQMTHSARLDSLFKALHPEFNSGDPDDLLGMEMFYLRQSGKLVDQQRQIIMRYQETMRTDILELLLAETTGRAQLRSVKDARFLWENGDFEKIGYASDSIRACLKAHHSLLEGVNEETLGISNSYVEYCYERFLLAALLDGAGEQPWEIFKQQFPGFLGEKLIATSFFSNYRRMTKADSVITVWLATFKNPRLKEVLNDLNHTLKKGADAYDFSLVDDLGKVHSLSDYRGKVVFLHFYFNGCAPCVYYYLNTLAPVEKSYETDPRVVFIAISIDKDRKSWIKGMESGRLTSPTAVNLFTDGKQFDHPMVRAYRVSGAPSVFLIDKNGKIMTNNIDVLGGIEGNPGKLKNYIEHVLAQSP